jgi:osmotically-inducible protein OsmY
MEIRLLACCVAKTSCAGWNCNRTRDKNANQKIYQHQKGVKMKENSLQLQVESALLQDRLTQDFGIEVLDSNGVVTLRGVVPSREVRDRAEAIVRTVVGVTNVINELDVI